MPKQASSAKKGEEKEKETLRSTVQDKVAEASGPLRRMAKVQEFALKLDRAKGREEILDVARNETKWLINYEVFFLATVNATRTHYVVSTLSPVADATELNHKHFSVDEGMPGWVI